MLQQNEHWLTIAKYLYYIEKELTDTFYYKRGGWLFIKCELNIKSYCLLHFY